MEEKKAAYLNAVVKGANAKYQDDYISVPGFKVPGGFPGLLLHPKSTPDRTYAVSMRPRMVRGTADGCWIATEGGRLVIYHKWFENIHDLTSETGFHAYLAVRSDAVHDLFHRELTVPEPVCVASGPVEPIDLVKCVLRRNKCYLCAERGLFYKAYCHDCAVLTFKFRLTIPTAEREMAPSMAGQRVLVTGGRIKIGFGTALACLRLGAEVTVTTRFARLAQAEYAKAPDYGAWRDRLSILEADFLESKSLLALMALLRDRNFTVIVQNAAQTVKNDAFTRQLRALNGARVTELLTGSAPGDEAVDLAERDLDLVAAHSQAMQIKTGNSWFLEYDEISLTEMLENLKINVVAPFLVIQAAGPRLGPGAVVVNVTSSEGAFRWKGGEHVHNNMCKAALDQMTLTLHQDFRKRGIRIYSCDPGFYSSANPNAIPPLELEDSVARIMQPILSAKVDPGWRFKDYKVGLN